MLLELAVDTEDAVVAELEAEEACNLVEVGAGQKDVRMFADEEQAAAVVEAVRSVDPGLPVMGLPGSLVLAMARDAGLPVITEAFARTHDALFNALEKVDDARLLEPVTDEKARARWPVVGGRVIFMCNNHLMMHLGQISTWRRCMGLPAA